MNYILRSLFLPSILIFTMSCGNHLDVTIKNANSSSGSSNPPLPTNSIKAIYDQLVTSVPAIGPISAGAYAASSGIDPIINDALWRNSSLNFTRLDAEPSTPSLLLKNFLGPASTDIGLLSKARVYFLVACLIDTLAAKDIKGAFLPGSFDLYPTDAWLASAVCAPANDDLAKFYTGGWAFKITVSTPSDTTYYDQKILLNSLDPTSGTPIYFYIRNSDTEFNMSFIEGSTNGSVPIPEVLSSRICSITYDKLTLTGSYQLAGISNENGGIGFLDRLYMDPAGDHVSILKYGSYSRNPGSAANDWTTTMSIATTYSAPSELALSLSWANVPDPAYSSNLDIGSACISTADGMIIENGTKTCSATRKTAKNSNAIELLGTAAKLRNTSPTPAYWILKADSDAYAVFLPSFNGSTIVTAPLGLPSN